MPRHSETAATPHAAGTIATEFDDSGLAHERLEQALRMPLRAGGHRWSARQSRSLLAAALIAGLGLLLLAMALADTRAVDARWHIHRSGSVELLSSALPSLAPMRGARLRELAAADSPALPADASVMMRSPRWSLQPVPQQRWLQSQTLLHGLLAQDVVALRFDGGREVRVPPSARGFGGLGALSWLAMGGALALALTGLMVMLKRPTLRNGLYLLMACSQAANLLAIGIESLPGLGLPLWYAHLAHPARMAFDLLTIGAIVQTTTLQPLRLPAARTIAALVWLGLAAVLAWAANQPLALAWWAVQGATLGGGALAIGLLSWSYRIEPNPYAVQMRRYALVGEGTLLLLTAAVLAASRQADLAQNAAAFASVVWYLFLACLLLLLPFLSRTRQLTRELAMLAGICTVAVSLDLLFTASTSLAPYASIALAVAASVVVFALTRRWLLRPMAGGGRLSGGRMFEWLYRMVRELEAQPQDGTALLTRFLRELFEPLDVQALARRPARARVLGDGAALLVPVPDIAGTDAVRESVLLRFAGQGRRLFTIDDARLIDRVVDQLRRAVAYDRAVERGRNEERARIAQDLHDDIGARLLTLMYKAQDPEIEDYIRNTLKDLKTLTRGLAATDHRLSHAAAEWKTDIAQRLGAAQIELNWSFSYDRDIELGVVQWSALTRVLRELVSNAIQHSCATRLEVAATLQGGRLRLSITDDGIGRDPQSWSHGLGLGGVRKRVKLLGGEVHWQQNEPGGIACVVVVPSLESK